jgi:hypothetical protein
MIWQRWTSQTKLSSQKIVEYQIGDPLTLSVRELLYLRNSDMTITLELATRQSCSAY